MKLGTFKCGDAKCATRAIQVSDHSAWDDYSSIQSGPQTIAVGIRVAGIAPPRDFVTV